MINNVTIVGRTGGDPKITKFNSGKKVAEFNIAVKKPVKDKEPVTLWFPVKVWDQNAETAENYLKKGHMVGIIGELDVESWEKDGQKHTKTLIHGRQLRLMEPKKKEESTSDDAGPFSEEEPANPWGD